MVEGNPIHGSEPSRSPHWATVEKDVRENQPKCIICGGTERIQIHHTFPPFLYCIAIGRPDLELDERNLYSLCEVVGMDHHLLCGHAGSFESFNESFHTNHHHWQGMNAEQIKADKLYQHLEATRPPHAREMTHEQLKTLRDQVDKLLPPDPAVLSRFGIIIHPFK